MLTALALVGVGALLIYSASLNQFGAPAMGDLAHPVMRQAVFAAGGLMIALALARANYRALGVLSVGMYVAAVAVLAFLLVAGDAT